MADEETLKFIPSDLKVLVQLIARTFYLPEHIVILDALIRHPCIQEEDLILLLCLEPKQVRQALHHLKKEKLVKSVQKNETEDGKTFRRSYHYVNYQLFVNVAKYKLDQMRKKVKSETREIQNRMSYICPDCQSRFSDMEADRLFDLATGEFRCTHCGATLMDDAPEVSVTSQNKLARLNSQLIPIEELLRKADKYTLDPSLLEPDPDQSRKGLVELKKMTRHKGGIVKGEKWSTGGGTNMYGTEAGIDVSIGDSNNLSKASAREQPEWLRTSAVAGEEAGGQDTLTTGGTGGTSSLSAGSSHGKQDSSHDIMANLLLHEHQPHLKPNILSGEGPHLRYSPVDEGEESDSSSSDDEQASSYGQLAEPKFSDGDDDDDDDDDTVMVGDEEVLLSEVSQDMVTKMTSEEKEIYTQRYRKAYAKYDYQ